MVRGVFNTLPNIFTKLFYKIYNGFWLLINLVKRSVIMFNRVLNTFLIFLLNLLFCVKLCNLDLTLLRLGYLKVFYIIITYYKLLKLLNNLFNFFLFFKRQYFLYVILICCFCNRNVKKSKKMAKWLNLFP